MESPPTGDTWVGLTEGALDLDAAVRWATRPSCGAVVVFSGTARDHSEGRDGVIELEYEAYEEEAERRLALVVDGLRARWSDVVAVALLHRTGRLTIGESAVLVAVSSPHRDAAFESARWAIDTLKQTVPIWKREHWDGGASWARDAQHVTDADLSPADR